VVAGEDTYDPEEASAQIRAGVVERLRARRAEIDEAIFARVSDRWFDRTGSEDPEYVAGMRAAGVAALHYILVGIERSGVSLQPVPVAVLEQARRAARTGVGLDTVLRRYLAGYAVLERFVIQEAEREELERIGSRPPSALGDVLQIVSVLIDRLITAVSSAYSKEVERAGKPAVGRRGAPAREDPDRQRSVASDESAVSSGRAAGSARARATQRDRTSGRERIIEAMVEVAAERGFENVTVKLLTESAGVSTRTFYEEFDSLRDCFLAALDLSLERAGGLITRAFLREERWQDGVLGALASLLVYFDSEPRLTRIWFVEASAAGSWALQRREYLAGALRSMIVEYWAARGEEAPEPVAAAGVMASVIGLIQTHLVTERPEPLVELLGPLMGLVTSLYLDKEDVAREVQRGARLAQEIKKGEALAWLQPPPVMGQVAGARQDTETGRDAALGSQEDEGVVIPARLANPGARRLRECLLYLAEQGERGIYPSNSEVGRAIGVTHKSQISRLLSYLDQQGLAVKRSEGGPGAPNAWRLTPRGEEVARRLGEGDGV
jgi:AcrR family transcriptional regulator